MDTLVDDLVGLNATKVRDQPVPLDASDVRRLMDFAIDHSLSVAGARHSQGGHTAVENGRMLLTLPALNTIKGPWPVQGQRHDALIEVDAGTTWEEVQRVAGYHGFAPMVQQSSPHFSVGGSLGANCHGRDPRWGPMACSVESFILMTPKGDLVKVSRVEEPALFKAVIGGYGACGMVLRVTLRLIANSVLEYVGDVFRRDAGDYARHVQELDSHPEVHLNYAWLSCVRGRFFEECIIADLKNRTPEHQLVGQDRFKEEEWGDGEVLRAGWSSARKDPGKMRRMVWEQLRYLHCVGGDGGKGSAATRIDWLRASVSFTAFRGTTTTDVLQEYFVPPDALVDMIAQLKKTFEAKAAFVNVLSSTLRLVRADVDDTLLSYCRGGPRVCIAVDAEVATSGAGAARDLHDDVKKAFREATSTAMKLGGSYYLPYFRVADDAMFRAAYGRHGEMQEAINTWNPKVNGRHRFWNQFLEAYFD